MSDDPRASRPAPPLAGITVVDFSELLPGPFFTQNLVEMGARVIKIERPPAGDNVRRMGSGVFSVVNRGKESRLVDLKDPRQRAETITLVETADVMVESYRPGVMAKYGLDYASLAERCPRLVVVSLSGYGQQGPWA
ncbi:MAG: CoA transferase, partial [Rhizobacter sp.]|nr:CoA transferase [Rhizobacter sp.]